MKRCELKRRTPLRAKTGLQRRAFKVQRLRTRRRGSYYEGLCDTLARAVVIGRSDGTCECPGCGRPGVERHHIVGRRQVGFADRHDPDLQIWLCDEHHQHGGQAAHVVGMDAFIHRLAGWMDPARLAKIASARHRRPRPYTKAEQKQVAQHLKAGAFIGGREAIWLLRPNR